MKIFKRSKVFIQLLISLLLLVGSRALNAQNITNHLILFYQLDEDDKEPVLHWDKPVPNFNMEDPEYQNYAQQLADLDKDKRTVEEETNDVISTIDEEFSAMAASNGLDKNTIYTLVALDPNDENHIVKILHSEHWPESLILKMVKFKDEFNQLDKYSKNVSKIEHISKSLSMFYPDKVFDNTAVIILNVPEAEGSDFKTLSYLLSTNDGFPKQPFKIESTSISADNDFFSYIGYLKYNESDISTKEEFGVFERSSTFLDIKRYAKGKDLIKLQITDEANTLPFKKNGVWKAVKPIEVGFSSKGNYAAGFWQYTDSIIAGRPVCCVNSQFAHCGENAATKINLSGGLFTQGIPVSALLNDVLYADPTGKDAEVGEYEFNMDVSAQLVNQYYSFLIYKTSLPVTVKGANARHFKMPDQSILVFTNATMLRLNKGKDKSEDDLYWDLVWSTKRKLIYLLIVLVIALFGVWFWYYGRKNKRLVNFLKNKIPFRKPPVPQVPSATSIPGV